jgi:hypothetical protein
MLYGLAPTPNEGVGWDVAHGWMLNRINSELIPMAVVPIATPHSTADDLATAAVAPTPRAPKILKHFWMVAPLSGHMLWYIIACRVGLQAILEIFAIMYRSMWPLNGAYLLSYKSILRFVLQHNLYCVQHFLSQCFALSLSLSLSPAAHILRLFKWLG